MFEDHISRRAMLKGTLATGGGLLVPNWGALANTAPTKRRKACILLWANGGASQIDTFDMKPGKHTGGPFRPVASKVPGIQLCEYLPKMGARMDRLAVIRSMRTGSPDHPDGIYHMHTCYKMSERTPHPEIGAMIARYLGRTDSDLPSFVRMGSVGNAGSGYLGPRYEPFHIGRAGQLPYFSVGQHSEETQRRRSSLLEFMEKEFTQDRKADPFTSHWQAKQSSWRLSRARSAFDITREWEKARDRYGNTEFARGCVMALKLIEAGVPFVEIGQENYDSHADNFVCHKANMRVLDPAWSALLDDLQAR